MDKSSQQISDPSPANENWLAFCSGDHAAFIQLYDQYYTLLSTWGCKWTNDDHEFVKDGLHDFFIYLWEKREQLSKNISVQAYLLTSFKRRLLYDKALQKRMFDGMGDADFDAPVQEDDKLAADIFKERFDKIKKAMDALSPAQREVIELRYLENKSLQEIAALKQTSIRTVYNLMHRGLSTLKSEALKKNFIFLW